MKTSSWAWAVIGFVVLAIVGVFWGWRESVWRDRISDEKAHAASADAQRVAVVAEYKDKMARLQPVILTRIKTDTLVLRRVTNLPASPAPICDSAIAVRDTVIAQLSTSVTEWRSLMQQQQDASARVLAGTDSLHNVQVDALHKQIDLYAHPPGKSLIGRILHPKVKPGAFAGVCTDGKPCAGLGVTVSF
jgi:uncharacterized coiled-coil protein SlyX